jgi:molybdate transport system regulatory protein
MECIEQVPSSTSNRFMMSQRGGKFCVLAYIARIAEGSLTFQCKSPYIVKSTNDIGNHCQENTGAGGLGLTTGKQVTALLKASSVLVMTDSSGIALSARNVLAGKVSKVSSGQVNAEVAIALASGATVYATITNDAVTELGIKEGASASAVFKASSVIIGVAG